MSSSCSTVRAVLHKLQHQPRLEHEQQPSTRCVAPRHSNSHVAAGPGECAKRAGSLQRTAAWHGGSTAVRSDQCSPGLRITDAHRDRSATWHPCAALTRYPPPPLLLHPGGRPPCGRGHRQDPGHQRPLPVLGHHHCVHHRVGRVLRVHPVSAAPPALHCWLCAVSCAAAKEGVLAVRCAALSWRTPCRCSAAWLLVHMPAVNDSPPHLPRSVAHMPAARLTLRLTARTTM